MTGGVTYFGATRWVTWSISLMLIWLNYRYGRRGQSLLDCQDQSFTQQLVHSLLHGGIIHLLVNLWSFYQLSYLEEKYGSWNYLLLVTILWLMSSALYWLINTYLLDTPICSIGFSGVILALLGWSRMVLTNGRFNLEEAKRWLITLVAPMIQNPRISLLGHASGLVSGLMLFVILGPVLEN